MPRPIRPATRVAQHPRNVDATWRGVVPPIQPSTTYERDPGYALADPDRAYTRGANPTERPAERLLAELEGGEDALLFSSGMAAATTLFATLRPGRRVAVPTVLYYGLRDWIARFADRWGVGVDTYDPTSLDSLQGAVRAGDTDWVWVETPSNPTWDVTDVAGAVDVAHAAGARVAVDNTVATPLLTQPLSFGADIVVHAATKYLNGHSDVLAGALVARAHDDLWRDVRWHREHGGAVLGPFESWLLLRGMRTLDVRVERSSASAMRLAEHFDGHPAVARVLYPGLPGHPGHDVAARQMRGGFGGMLSFEIAGGEPVAAAVVAGVERFVRATSLGGIESLIEHRAIVEGPTTEVAPNLLRMSIGLEAVDDLIDDLEHALTAST